MCAIINSRTRITLKLILSIGVHETHERNLTQYRVEPKEILRTLRIVNFMQREHNYGIMSLSIVHVLDMENIPSPSLISHSAAPRGI